MKKKKGFTLIELLVVIAIIAMLLAILMPALGKVKKLAMRLICATNLKGMSTAMNVYAFDYNDEYPIAGGGGLVTWGDETPEWANTGFDWSGDDKVSVSASLFMLVREADVGVKSFICKASDQQKFVNETPDDIIELWDFGQRNHANYGDYGPAKCQSYSYQIPYRMEFGKTFNYPADGTSNPGNAVMADRNPWYDDKMTKGPGNSSQFLEFVALLKDEWTVNYNMQKWEEQLGNSEAHDREGQNVLFNDGHVDFTKRADVGTRYDNIYTMASGGVGSELGRRRGDAKSAIAGAGARNSEDSMLVGDQESQ